MSRERSWYWVWVGRSFEEAAWALSQWLGEAWLRTWPVAFEPIEGVPPVPLPAFPSLAKEKA